MTKLAQSCLNLEKQKTSFEQREETLKKEVEMLRVSEKSLLAKLAEIPEPVQVVQVEQVHVQAPAETNDQSASLLAKIDELTSEISAKESELHSLKSDYDAKLNESNEKHCAVSTSLKTQEALTKDLELQLENQNRALKQKESELCAVKTEVDSINHTYTNALAENQAKIDKAVEDLNATLREKSDAISRQGSMHNKYIFVAIRLVS